MYNRLDFFICLEIYGISGVIKNFHESHYRETVPYFMCVSVSTIGIIGMIKDLKKL